MANFANECNLQYKKNKSAIQGVTGQLYESKLISLILYRLLNNSKVKEFYMGSNLDGIGDMDDICIRMIHEDCEKPLLILIQAKHKDNPENGILYDHFYQSKSDFYLPKNCNSLLKVKEKFAKIKNDIMFIGDFDDLSHYFVFYTPAVSENLTKIKEPEPSTNIDIVKNLINSSGGKVHQIDYDDDDITKIKDGASTCDSIANEFFENVYFFTDQGKEDEVERELEKEIAENRTPNGTLTQLQMKPTVAYLHFYNGVHKWWLSSGNVYYLTKTCNYFDPALNNTVVDVFLNVLSYNCVNHLELYPIEFNMLSMDSADILLGDVNEPSPLEAKITKIVSTNSVLLTGIKLKQYLTSRDFCSYYLSYSYVSKMTDSEFNILLREIEETVKHILVIICDTLQVPNKRLEDINACGRNIVIVVDESQNDLGSLQGSNVKSDYIRGLVDISHDEYILEYKVTIQGVQTCLNNIIDDNSKKIINAEILLTILNNERIELGRSLFDYNSNKHWFDVREVTNETGTYIIDTTNDNIGELPILKNKSESGFDRKFDKVVVITAEPGMGKTTLLSHLSQRKKTSDLKTWIVRVDLQDYSEEFNRWKDNGIEIGLKETMLLICKAELERGDFDLVITENRIDVLNIAIRGTDLLLLEYIVNCFNEGRILYLFDGFDRICPHHEKVALKFIRNLTLSDLQVLQESQVWITSRAYKIANDALRDFGEPLALNPLSISQQKEFYISYWHTNISRKNLNINDSNKLKIWQNIRNFFNNMQGLRSARRHLDIMYETAWNYLQNEYNGENITDEEYNEDIYDEKNTYRPSEREIELHLSGIPLYMELYAIKFSKHLTKYILTTDNEDVSQNPEILWECDTYTFFKGLHDSEFEKVFYNGKNAFGPDARARCEAAKLKSNERHKILAFYALFNDAIDREYITELSIKLDVVFCDNIKNGKEKTGMIETIRQDIPKFVHQAFAECYAVEFITDLLKNNKNKRVATINLIINRLLDNNIGMMSAFEEKLKNDNELLKLLSEKQVKLYIFDALIEQDAVDENSLHKVLVQGFKETAKMLVQSIEVITDVDNIRHFVKFIKADFFIYAASLNYNDLIEYVIRKIKIVDSSMIEDIRQAIIFALNQNSSNINENMMETIEKQLTRMNLN